MKFFLIVNFLIFCLIAQAGPLEKVLERADGIRNPASSFFMQVQVESDGNTSLLDVYLQGQNKTLIVTREPARDKGRNMLMLDRDFHAYVPNLKRSMRLSLSQKLSGQVANGDIARTRWAGDYEPSLVSKANGNLILKLKALKDNLTYAYILLTVEEKTAKPISAQYLGTDGITVLKKAYFEDFKNLAGANRPSTIRIEDSSKKNSYIRIMQMTTRSYEDSFFTTRNMETFK